MMFALNLGENGRVLSATLPEYAPSTQPQVESLPEGDLYEYRYVDGDFIHDPLPEQEEETPTPTQLDRVEAQTMYTALMTDTLLEDE